MTVTEALEWSKANGGEHCMRIPLDGVGGGLIKYVERNVYTLTTNDLLATDWLSLLRWGNDA